MSNFIVIPGSSKQISTILKKNINGIIIGVKNLSIYDCELEIDKIIDIANITDKKVIVAINKMIHNDDLILVEKVLEQIKNSKIYGILFYDLGVFNVIKRLDIHKELIIGEEHLNTSTLSNNFYYNRGIGTSYISSDITYEEVEEIKNNTKMKIFYTVYGYLPIFYSRRKLISSYFDYIFKDKQSDNYYMTLDDKKHLIKERDYGSIIYSNPINLQNEISKIDEAIYLVIDLSFTDDVSIIDKFVNGEEANDTYIGFFNTKTIYKLKEEKKI